nr:RHS repeat-associated core domain-containing protein [Neisseria sp. 83E34]
MLDRLVAESGFDRKLTAYHYNAGNELVQQSEYGILDIPAETNLSDGLKDCTPLIVSDYVRDGSGRLKHIEVRSQNGSVQQRSYHYDVDGRLVRAATAGHSSAFDYNTGGGLIGEYALRLPDAASCAAQGLPELDWQNPEHDMFLLGKSADIRYFYSAGGNLATVELPDGQRIHNLYYGSGHLHGILFDGDTVTDIERDKLHREISRTQGALTSRYELDPLGRLKKQIAQLATLTETGKSKYTHTAVNRSYGYGRTGNLTHTTDQRSGTTHFEYDKLVQIAKTGNALFAFDPAHNLLSTRTNNTLDSAATPLSDGLKAVSDNRIREYNGAKFFYDHFGNTIHKEHPDGTTQNLYYDLFHQLVKTETFRHNPNTGEWEKEIWVYDYDAMGRRIRKGRLKADGSLGDATEFIWSGSRLLQEVYADGRYTYIYTDTDSYEPLAQIHNYTNEAGETYQDINYFHCDQIGIPREMTDRDGNLIWFGEYDAWGKLVKETNVTGRAHQPFRLQNQYCDRETGLHYNFFRYYDPDIGRFVNQDPIGLWGGENLYQYAPNIQIWFDSLGLQSYKCIAKEKEGGGGLGYRDGRKLCTYTCTNIATNKSVDILSNSDISDGSSQYCRGAVVATTYSPLTGRGVGHATHYEPFDINTNSWYWDGWGGTKDIYEQLKGIPK